MKTLIDQFEIDECGANPATGKPGKRNKEVKKMNGQPNVGSMISPDSCNVRGNASNAGYLRQTPAP